MEPESSLPCSLVPILSQINPLHTTPSCPSLCKIHYNIIHPSGLFPFGFPINILYAFLFASICATCPAYLFLLDLNILIILHEE
jgi:hypothetical protein